jgi:hypothetical protein
MKYIRGLPAHIRNTVFMFGPTNIDEVYAQTTYIEAGKTVVGVSGESSSRRENKRKGNGKKANSTTRKKGTMMTIAGNCTQRRDQSGSNKGNGGKHLQQQHDQQKWDMIQVMRLKSQQLV